MRALENPAAAEELVRLADEYSRERNPRAEGIHVSDLIRCRRQGWYQLNGYPTPPHSTQTLLLFLMGQGHHALLELGEPETHLEITTEDGIRITGTADRQEEEGFPGELKTTRASYGRMKLPSEHYVEQAASYAVMQGVDHARIYVVFLLGDYKGAKIPRIRAWDLQFTRQELDAWSREMARRARVLAGPELPALDEHATWECNYCPFAESRGGPCAGGDGHAYQWFPAQQDLTALVMSEGEMT